MKKIVSVLLSISVFFGISAYAVEYGEELQNMPKRTYEQKFSDIPQTHWAFEYISELVNDNVLSGYPDGKFRPNNNVTRAEFAKIMISASGIQVAPSNKSSFEDVSTTDWYCPYIESAKDFLTGFQYGGSAMYLPNKAAIREDIAVALVKLKGYDTSVADLGMIQTMFSDYNSISESAKRYVAVAVERGLVSGYEDGTFRGQRSITRAEAATLIWRANQYGLDNKILGSEISETPATPVVTPKPEPETVPEPTPEPTKKPYKAVQLKNKSDIGSANRLVATNDSIIYLNSNNEICRLNVFDNQYEIITSVIDWIESNKYDGLNTENLNVYNDFVANIKLVELKQFFYDAEGDLVYFMLYEDNTDSVAICSISSDNTMSAVYDNGKYQEWGGYDRIIPKRINGIQDDCIYMNDNNDEYCLELDTKDIYKESYNKPSINKEFGKTSNLTLFEENVYLLKDNQINIYNNTSGDFVNMINFGHDVENPSNVPLAPGEIEYLIIIDADNFALYNKNDKFVLITKNE